MRNIFAIAQKELKAYFASPIAYVIIGLFALLFGYFYSAILSFFLRQSLQVGQFGFGGPATINVNQDLIRPLMINATVIILFVMPMVTMRSYSEEKRSGTIELLLTSPVSDWHIILGKFAGAMALYGMMLAATLFHIGLLFLYGEPEWMPVVIGYLGLLLLGGCFVSVGLLISSMTSNQVVSGMATFAVFLLLWDGRLYRSRDSRSANVFVHYWTLRGFFSRRSRHKAHRVLPELHRIRVIPDS